MRGSEAYRSRYLYELRGVVVHSGSAFAGHYYSFVQERPRVWRRGEGSGGSGAPPRVAPGRWFKFDDRCVSAWDVANLEEECFGGPAPVNVRGTSGSDSDLDTCVQQQQQQRVEDRAHSAFMLVYDRMDGGCVEEEPVMSYMPAACYAPPPLQPTSMASPAGGGSSCWDGSPASGQPRFSAGSADRQRKGSSSGATTSTAVAAAGAALLPATPTVREQAPLPATDGDGGWRPPYGLDEHTYLDVLASNASLVRRTRALDKSYAHFLRKVRLLARSSMERLSSACVAAIQGESAYLLAAGAASSSSAAAASRL
jgi:hypothetical protein